MSETSDGTSEPPWPALAGRGGSSVSCYFVGIATAMRLGVLEGGGERVLRRAGDRPGQDLQRARAGLHVDRRARGHRADRLAAHGGLAVRDLAKIDNRQLC